MKTKFFQYHPKSGWLGLDEASSLNASRTLVLCFVSPEINKNELIRPVLDAFKDSHIIGASTAGEIYKSSLYDHSISCVAIQFANVTLISARQRISDASQSEVKARKLGEIVDQPEIKACISFCDGLHTNGSAFARGLQSAFSRRSPVIFGGLAADGPDFKRTFVIDNEGIHENSAVCVGLAGDVLVDVTSQGGWDPFGPERRITRSQDNIVYEIDGQSGLDLYRKYLGDKAQDLPGSGLLFPLEIRPEKNSDHFLVRTLLKIDEESGALIFAGDVPQGHYARLMRGNFNRLVNFAGKAGAELACQNGSHAFALAISCVGRRILLGAQIEEEIDALTSELKTDAVIGFYSYGELSPRIRNRVCELHNQTMSLMVIKSL